MRQAILGGGTAEQMYDRYIAVRAEWLGLNPNDPADRVLVRVGAMCRLFTKEEGAILRSAIGALSEAERTSIIKRLAIKLPRTPTYIPAVLANLGPEKAIKIGLPFIGRVLAVYAEVLQVGAGNPAIPLNFNAVARLAQSNPEALKNARFTIIANGEVRISGGL